MGTDRTWEENCKPGATPAFVLLDDRQDPNMLQADLAHERR
jgi:hypothetical protein